MEGRVIIVGRVTTSWDMAHAVVAAMGDRFVLIRANSRTHRKDFARQAIMNTGSETTMREELAQSVGALIANASTDEHQLEDSDMERLVNAANVVTWARTGVERDYRGDVILDHDPEMPTRFVKQLVQLVRGAVAIGKLPKDALTLALRCARDSLRPLRRELLIDIAACPDSTPRDVYRRIGRPRTTVRRELEALHMLQILSCEEVDMPDQQGKVRTIPRYRIATTFDSDTLLEMVKLDQKQTAT